MTLKCSCSAPWQLFLLEILIIVQRPQHPFRPGIYIKSLFSRACSPREQTKQIFEASMGTGVTSAEPPHAVLPVLACIITSYQCKVILLLQINGLNLFPYEEFVPCKGRKSCFHQHISLSENSLLYYRAFVVQILFFISGLQSLGFHFFLLGQRHLRKDFIASPN